MTRDEATALMLATGCAGQAFRGFVEAIMQLDSNKVTADEFVQAIPPGRSVIIPNHVTRPRRGKGERKRNRATRWR